MHIRIRSCDAASWEWEVHMISTRPLIFLGTRAYMYSVTHGENRTGRIARSILFLSLIKGKYSATDWSFIFNKIPIVIIAPGR